MTDTEHRIRDLDLSLFDQILTQTSKEDRRALLGVQRAVMMKHGQFAYLEIGSHLGGSIQPYLLNPTCTHIYSIDPRPPLQPDDRAKRYIAHYPENSTHRMLENLGAIDPDAVRKVQCFDVDAREVDPSSIKINPMIAFIDGEHTRKAVNSDFDFCLRVLAKNGVIVLHDFHIIYRAVFDALHKLRERDHVAYLIEGDVFSVFLDPLLVREDEYLHTQFNEHRHSHLWVATKRVISPFTPKWVRSTYRSMRAPLQKRDGELSG